MRRPPLILIGIGLVAMVALACAGGNRDEELERAHPITAQPTVIARSRLVDGPKGVAANPTTNRIYVATNRDDTLSVIKDLPVTPTASPTPAQRP